MVPGTQQGLRYLSPEEPRDGLFQSSSVALPVLLFPWISMMESIRVTVAEIG